MPICYSEQAVRPGGEILNSAVASWLSNNAVASVLSTTVGFALSFAICCALIALRNLRREKGKKRPLAKALFPAIALTIPLLGALTLLLEHSPPSQVTSNSIVETFVRIELYAKQHGSLPHSLDALPRREGYANETRDGWDRRLLYDINSDGTITLASLGKDGRPGGDGDNADLIATCRAYRPDGSLWIGAGDWDQERDSCTAEMFSFARPTHAYRKK